jgi:hypothetical protein
VNITQQLLAMPLPISVEFGRIMQLEPHSDAEQRQTNHKLYLETLLMAKQKDLIETTRKLHAQRRKQAAMGGTKAETPSAPLYKKWQLNCSILGLFGSGWGAQQ